MARLTTMTGVRRLGHVPELDGVRGIAITAVVADHAAKAWFPGGALGVDLFFVLSGFLITSLLLEEWSRNDRIGLRNFWMRRALRLLPALVVFLPVACAVAVLAGAEPGRAATSGAVSLFYVGNIAMAAGFAMVTPLEHMWSLSIEEQFYLVWPCLVLLCLRLGLPRRAMVAMTAVLIVAGWAWTTFLHLDGTAYGRIKFGPDTRAATLLVGCLTAMLVSWGYLDRSLGRRPLRAAGGLALAFVIGWVLLGDGGPAIDHLATWAYPAIALAGAFLILATLGDPPSALRTALQWRPLRWAGRISYGTYLWHFLVLFAVERALGDASRIVVIAVAVPASLLIAEASWRYVETPFLRRKERYSPDRAPTGRAAAPAVTDRRR